MLMICTAGINVERRGGSAFGKYINFGELEWKGKARRGGRVYRKSKSFDTIIYLSLFLSKGVVSLGVGVVGMASEKVLLL